MNISFGQISSLRIQPLNININEYASINDSTILAIIDYTDVMQEKNSFSIEIRQPIVVTESQYVGVAFKLLQNIPLYVL